jgi:uncharacterized protein (DUF2252 family)
LNILAAVHNNGFSRMKTQPPLTAKERMAYGKSQRNRLRRVDQGELRPKERGFDPIHTLQASAAGRLRQLLPIKYDRMRVSPFAFFRGAVSIMAADLGRLPHTGIMVQLCGDAHVQNLGSFAAPDGKLVFDFNDFDETIRGPWEWDAKRMVSSIVLAGRAAGQKVAACQAAVEAFLSGYLDSMSEFARLPILAAARHQIHREDRVTPISEALRQSSRATPAELLKKLTVRDGRGHWRFADGRPLHWRVRGEKAKEALAALAPYRDSLPPESRQLFDLFRPVDVGFKVVGTGSVGMRDYVVLLEGNGPSDALFLQIKQEMASAYARYLTASAYEHEGRRVAQGQRAIQPQTDPLLGWTSMGGHEFLVRQLNDHKGGIDLAWLRGAGLASLAEVAGELMARGHARSGDACVISGYCGSGLKLKKALQAFAFAYADQTEADYTRFSALPRP